MCIGRRRIKEYHEDGVGGGGIIIEQTISSCKYCYQIIKLIHEKMLSTPPPAALNKVLGARPGSIRHFPPRL